MSPVSKKRVECPFLICEKTFKTRKGMNLHCKYYHRDKGLLKENIDSFSRQKFKKQINLAKVSKNKDSKEIEYGLGVNYRTSRRGLFKNDDDDLKNPNKPKQEPIQYICNDCYKSYNVKKDLMEHKKVKHMCNNYELYLEKFNESNILLNPKKNRNNQTTHITNTSPIHAKNDSTKKLYNYTNYKMIDYLNKSLKNTHSFYKDLGKPKENLQSEPTFNNVSVSRNQNTLNDQVFNGQYLIKREFEPKFEKSLDILFEVTKNVNSLSEDHQEINLTCVKYEEKTEELENELNQVFTEDDI